MTSDISDNMSGYKICSEENLESEINEKAAAEIHTLVDAASYIKIYKFFGKNHIPAAIVFFAAAFAITAYSVVNVPNYDENKIIFIFLAACIPLGIGVSILIYSYLTSGKSKVKFHKKLCGEEDICYDLLFYSDKFAFNDCFEMKITGTRHFVLIPYDKITKIIVNDDAVAIIDQKNFGITAMRKDMPEWFLKWITEKCPQAELSEHCENNKIQGD